MKKAILSIICVLLITLNCFALDEYQVRIVGYYQKPGGNYVELTTPSLPTDIVNLKYTYILTAEDDEHSAIDCIIRFPKCLNIVLKSQVGVQPLVLEDGQTTAMLTFYEKGDYKYCEFLIPQRESGTGFVEFQVKDGYKLKGKDMPVEFVFTHYRQSFLKRNAKVFCIAGAVAAGAAVTIFTAGIGAPAAAGMVSGAAALPAASGLIAGAAVVSGSSIAAGVATAAVVGIASTQIAKKAVSEKIQEIKEKYTGTKMNDSYHVFTLQFR